MADPVADIRSERDLRPRISQRSDLEPMSVPSSLPLAHGFGALIRSRRLDRGISKRVAARALGCYPSTLSNYEENKARRLPTPAMLAALSELLDISVAELMAAALPQEPTNAGN
jgi:ribosome-binding protein aMBF1 (putative translation factor)